MTLDALLQTIIATGSVGLAFFCVVLSRRLRRLNDLETGLGGAIAIMAAEVDRLEKAIIAARDEARTATEGLATEITRSRSERAHWELQRKLAHAMPPPPPPPLPQAPLKHSPQRPRRLRKRMEYDHA